MGTHPNISADKFPRQGSYLGQRCKVMFNYSEPTFLGKVIRDDAEEPGHMIIQLDNGRVVLTTECQWQPFSLARTEGSA